MFDQKVLLTRRPRRTRLLPGEQEQLAPVVSDNSPAALVRRSVERTLPNPVTGTPPPPAAPPSTGALTRRSVEAPDPAVERRNQLNQALWDSLRTRDAVASTEQNVPTSAERLARDGGLLTRNTDEPAERLRRVIADEAEQLANAPRRELNLPSYQPLERAQKTGVKNRLLGALEGAGQGFLQTGKVEGALGGALAGAVNRDGPRQAYWQQHELPRALVREQQARQNEAAARKDAVERFGSLTHAATAMKALREPAPKPDPLTRFQFNPQSGVFYRTRPDGSLEYQQVDLPYTLPSGGKRFLGTQPIAANPVTPKPAAAPRGGQQAAPKYSLTDAQQEQLAADGSPEAIVEAGLRERLPVIEANLPGDTLQILRTGKKPRTMRDATGKTVTMEVAATPAEVIAARKLRDDAIERERKRMLVETRATAQRKAAQRYLGARNGVPAAAGAPGYGEAPGGALADPADIDDVLLERREAIEAALPPGVLELVQTGRKPKIVRDPATGREQELLTKATPAEIAAARQIYYAAIERERRKLAAPSAQRPLNKRNSGTTSAPAKATPDELNRYAEWLRGKGLSEAEIQQRLQQHR